MIDITSGTLDNDPKGESGRGTKFWMEIKVDGEVKRYEYFLKDLLDGTFNKAEILNPFVKLLNEKQKEINEKLEKDKKETLSKRADSVKVPNELGEIIRDVLNSSTKIIEQYKNGNDKVLNSLVGMVLSRAKKMNFDIDAFVVNVALKKSIGE